MERKIILAKYIAIVTFKSIWLAFSALWLVLIFEFMGKVGGFGGWLVGGLVSVPLLLIDLFKTMKTESKKGEIEGANTYYVKDYGSYITISNSPNMGFFKGILLSIGAYIFVGVVLLILKIITNILAVIMYSIQISALKRDIANEKK